MPSSKKKKKPSPTKTVVAPKSPLKISTAKKLPKSANKSKKSKKTVPEEEAEELEIDTEQEDANNASLIRRNSLRNASLRNQSPPAYRETNDVNTDEESVEEDEDEDEAELVHHEDNGSFASNHSAKKQQKRTKKEPASTWTNMMTDILTFKGKPVDSKPKKNHDAGQVRKDKETKKGKGKNEAIQEQPFPNLEEYHPEIQNGCSLYGDINHTYIPELADGGMALSCRRYDTPRSEAMMQAQQQYIAHTEVMAYSVANLEEMTEKSRLYAEKYKEDIQQYVSLNPSTEGLVDAYLARIERALEVFHADLEASQDILKHHKHDSAILFLRPGDLDRLAFRGCLDTKRVLDNAELDIFPVLLELKHVMEMMVANKDIKTSTLAVKAVKHGWSSVAWWKQVIVKTYRSIKAIISKLINLVTVRRVGMVVAIAGVAWYAGPALGLALTGGSRAGYLGAVSGLFRGLCPLMSSPIAGIVFMAITQRVLSSLFEENTTNPKKHVWLGKLKRWALGLGTGGASELYIAAAKKIYSSVPSGKDFHRYADKTIVDAGSNVGLYILQGSLILSFTGLSSLLGHIVCPLIVNPLDTGVTVGSAGASFVGETLSTASNVTSAVGSLGATVLDYTTSTVKAAGKFVVGQVQAVEDSISKEKQKELELNLQRQAQKYGAMDSSKVPQAMLTVTAFVVKFLNDTAFGGDLHPSEEFFEKINTLCTPGNATYASLIQVVRSLLCVGSVYLAVTNWGGPEQLNFEKEIPERFRKLKPIIESESMAVRDGTYRQGLSSELVEARKRTFLGNKSVEAQDEYFDRTRASKRTATK